MNKFKVGDKVKLKDSITSVYLDNNTIYTVSEVFYKKLRVQGEDFKYNEDTFDLVSSDSLLPLEAAEAILNKEPLQEFCENTGKWFDFACSVKGVTLDALQNTKFRRKPKTAVINGVEVVAPMSLKEILECKDRREGYVIELAQRKVYSKRILQGQIIWATEEDAQKALDAMLIPFKENNND